MFWFLHPCLSYPHLAGGNSFSWALLPEEVSAQRMDRPWTERAPVVQSTTPAICKVLNLPVEESRGNLQSHWRKRKVRETWRDCLLEKGWSPKCSSTELLDFPQPVCSLLQRQVLFPWNLCCRFHQEMWLSSFYRGLFECLSAALLFSVSETK